MTVFRDTALVAGDPFERKLARALCQSLYIILVSTPQYGASGFCQREYAAMRQLERHRFEGMGSVGHPGTGMIIPIILRGARYLPEHLRGRHHLDFPGYTTADQAIIKNRECVEQIDRVAERIYALYCKLKDVRAADHMDCGEFALPARPFDDIWPEPGKAAMQEFSFEHRGSLCAPRGDHLSDVGLVPRAGAPIPCLGTRRVEAARHAGQRGQGVAAVVAPLAAQNARRGPSRPRGGRTAPWWQA